MADVGGPFPSGHGPVERAGVLNFAGRAGESGRRKFATFDRIRELRVGFNALATKAHSFAKSAKQIILFSPTIVP